MSVWVIALAAMLIAGCGGSSHSPNSTTKSSTTTGGSTTAKQTKPKGPPVPATVTETVHPSTAGVWQPTLKVASGDRILLRTAIPGTAKSRPIRVNVKIELGPASKLTVTATGKGHTSKAVLTSSSGKPVTLQDLHYGCELPPAPSFCPPVHASTDGHTYQLTFSSVHPAPVILAGVVGPTASVAPKARPVGGAVVPPYRVEQTARILPASATKGGSHPLPATTISAKPGDIVDLRTRVLGNLTGAPQTVTITLNQGPGKSVTVSAAVAGGATATATINAASGSNIALVLPRYVCYLAPAGTFCPAKSLKAAHHRYTLSFNLAPTIPPVDIVAKVLAG